MSAKDYSDTKYLHSPAKSLMVLLWLCVCMLPYVAAAQAGPHPQTAVVVVGKQPLHDLQQHYQAWDTSRVDEQTAQLYVDLSAAYAEHGDKANAYHYFERYREVKDSIFLKAKNVEIDKLKQDVAAASQDKELAARNTQLVRNQVRVNRQNAIMLGLAGGILLILILCLQSVKSYRDRRRLLQKIREQSDQDMVLSMLQASRQGEHRERDRIAAQLHSSIRPLLQEVQLQLDDIQQRQETTQRSGAFIETQSIIGDVQEELEHIATALSTDTPSPGLVAMVGRFMRNIPGDNDLSVSLQVSGDERPLPPESEQMIYRMLQELVQNIMKHARAHSASISLYYAPTHLNIRVQDDGLGFKAQSFDAGMGWPNIQERVSQLNGSCSRFNDAGTIVLIEVPV